MGRDVASRSDSEDRRGLEAERGLQLASEWVKLGTGHAVSTAFEGKRDSHESRFGREGKE